MCTRWYVKQYSGGAADADDHVAENEDSLSALLQRQNKHYLTYTNFLIGK